MTAKRHHYVPRMLLKRFATDPSDKHPRLLRLELATGKTLPTSVQNEAVIGGYNTLKEEAGVDPLKAETAFSEIESVAQGAIHNLVASASKPEEACGKLAIFLWMQHARTPLGRAWMTEASEQAAKISVLEAATEPDFFHEVTARLDESLTPEEIEERRRDFLNAVVNDELEFVATSDQEVIGQFYRADVGARMLIEQMTWLGYRPAGNEAFILSDHPVAFVDENAQPKTPVTWFSSRTVEITLPLDPHFCLALRQGPPIYREVSISDEEVENINLRSYAWAHWNIYGHTHKAVQHTRELAKRKKKLVWRMEPRPPMFITIDQFGKNTAPSNVTTLRLRARGQRSRRNREN